MKRLLRSVLDIDGGISQENLCHNFQKLMTSKIQFPHPEDQKIFEYIKAYFQNSLEMPARQTLIDYYEKVNDIAVIERIADIAAAPSYIRTNYKNLLETLVEDQNRIKVVTLLDESKQIITKGLMLDGERQHGVKAGIQHFSQNAIGLMAPTSNLQSRGSLRDDGNAVWNEYLDAKANLGKNWGAFSGLNNIDKVCQGIKRGELWIHAAFTGELKCLPGDVTVFDHRTQRRRRLKEMFDCKSLPTVTALEREGATNRLVLAAASHLVQNGEREVFDLTLSSGRSIGATSNHKFFTPSGWKELAELQEGDFVATPKVMRVAGARPYTVSEVKLVGYLIGDGTVNNDIVFTQSGEEIRQDFVSCLESMGLREGDADYEMAHYNLNFPEDRTPYVRVARGLGDRWHRTVSPVRVLLETLDLYGKDSYGKRIPSEFFGMAEDLTTAFLGALWSTDGSYSSGTYTVSRKDPERNVAGETQDTNQILYSSVSLGLCQDIQSLLLHIGVPSTVSYVDTTLTDGRPYRFWVTRVVTNPGKRRFCELVHPIGKVHRAAQMLERLPPGDNTKVPSCLLPDGQRVMIGNSWRYARTSRNHAKTVTTDVADKFGVDTGDVYWDQVESVVSRGVEMTYDLSVPEHHTFVANDIITHNTTFATSWAYNLVTRYRSNVFYASLEMKYEHIRKLIYAMHSTNLRFTSKGYKPLDYRKVRGGELSPEEEKFFQYVIEDFTTNKEYGSFDVWAPEDDVTIDDIRTEAEIQHKQAELSLLVVDHSLLVEPRKKKRSKDFTIEANSVVRDTKKMALHFNGGESIGTLLLFQLNRVGKDEADKADGMYKIKALAYANEAERSADVITTTYLNDQYREKKQTKFCCLKNRDNPIFDPFLASVNFESRRIYNMNVFAGSTGKGMSLDDYRASTGEGEIAWAV